MSEAVRPSLWSAFAGFVRQVVRQLSAAVYVCVAYALVASQLMTQPWWLLLAIQLTITAAGGAILAAVITGPFRHVGFVGLFVGLILSSTVFVFAPEQNLETFGSVAISAALLTVAGALGAWIVWRRRKRLDSPAPVRD